MTDHEDDFSVSMIVDPLYYNALETARCTLAGANMLHADCLFDGPYGKDNVLYSCFNPARAAGEALIKNVSIMSIVDSNFISGLRRMLGQKPGVSLNKENREILAFLVLSAMCDGAITPGMAFLEMHANTSGLSHLVESYNAFEFLCTEVDLNLLCQTLVRNKIPDWNLKKPLSTQIPDHIRKRLRGLPDVTRYKSELFSTILAATIEVRYKKTLTNRQKFEKFITEVHNNGALAMGSMRYFALYFSQKPSKIGVERKSMLKSIHSGSCEKVRRGVLNAASDCYFSSEYSSSLNSFRERGSPRVFVTSDSALKFVMSSDFHDRSLWAGGISSVLDYFRDDRMSEETAQLLNEAVPMFDAESVPECRPPLRPSAKRFLERQDEALAAGWGELMELIEK